MTREQVADTILDYIRMNGLSMGPITSMRFTPKEERVLFEQELGGFWHVKVHIPPGPGVYLGDPAEADFDVNDVTGEITPWVNM